MFSFRNLDIYSFDVLVNALWLILCGLMKKVDCRWANNSTSTLEFENDLHFDLDRVCFAHVRKDFPKDYGTVESTINTKEKKKC
jgi:hypothetical protein